MGDVFGFLFLVGFIYFMLWNTKTDPPKGVPGPSRPDDGVPNRRADGSIVGQVRGLNPWSEGPDGIHPASERRAWPPGTPESHKGLGAE